LVDEDIQNIIKFEIPEDENSNWSESEKKILTNLIKKECKTFINQKDDVKNKGIVWISLLDILLSYCYNKRITFGENNVESGWNISIISYTLSWLDVHFIFKKGIERYKIMFDIISTSISIFSVI
jgi:hypothetical protein